MTTEETWIAERKEYTDAELYLIVVARTLLDGQFASKAEFDSMVRSMGDIEAAKKLIEFRDKRPGCIASEYPDGFSCACGVKWDISESNPPCCQFDRLN